MNNQEIALFGEILCAVRRIMIDPDFDEEHLDIGDTAKDGSVYWIGENKAIVERHEYIDPFKDEISEGDHLRIDEQPMDYEKGDL